MKNRSPIKSQRVSEEQLYWMPAIFVAICTVLFYLPIASNHFVNWDDTVAITENYHIRSLNPSSLQWMFTTFHTGNWIPLTWLSLALDYAIGGLNPTIYHVHNLLLHVSNTLLIFFLSLKILRLAAANDETKSYVSVFFEKSMGKKIGKITPRIGIAILTALLFSLHPIHVESVAWATERKDLLCSLFFLAALLIYLDDMSSKETKIGKWTICLGLFALALLSKPMAVTLPLVLLLLDVWPLNRFKANFPKVLWEKIPFFVLSLIIAVITIRAQSDAGAILNIAKLSIAFQIMNAFHSLIFYVWKMILPFDLVPFYPITHQGQHTFSTPNIIAFLLVILISITCFFYRKNKPYLIISWLYYVITLLPVLGILQVGSQAAADRYSYLPSLSLFLLFSTSIFILFSNHQVILTALSTAIVVALGFATMNQLVVWKNSVNLWESVVKVYPNISVISHTNMANAYKQMGQLDKALKEYNRALTFPNPHAYIHDGKGTVLLDKGLVDEAIQEFKQAITLNSTYASPHRNLWFAYEKKGWYDLALAEILEAVKINPEFAEAYNNLGVSYGREARFEESTEVFKKALSIDPHNSIYLVNLATTYQRSGQLDKAIDAYKKGIRMNSSQIVYFLNLSNTYSLKGMFAEAIQTLQDAARIQPSNPEIFLKLGTTYEKSGQHELAIQNYEKAKQLSRKK